jgi:hypothetical protein
MADQIGEVKEIASPRVFDLARDAMRLKTLDNECFHQASHHHGAAVKPTFLVTTVDLIDYPFEIPSRALDKSKGQYGLCRRARARGRGYIPQRCIRLDALRDVESFASQ